MDNKKSPFDDNQLIRLKDQAQLEKYRFAGSVAAKCLSQVESIVQDKIPNLSLKDLESECVKIIESSNCIPTFLGYKGFPGAICASVNKQIVHGIPNSYVLKEGDVLKIDVGATYGGIIGDSAITLIYGDPKEQEHLELLNMCEGSLYAAISAIKIGNRLGCIGDTIRNYVKSTPFSIITDYGGHGLSTNNPHSQPFVPNIAKKDEGIRIQPGLVIAIEPMLVIGGAKTSRMRDGWTVCGMGISAHYEHTVFITETGVEVMTMRE